MRMIMENVKNVIHNVRLVKMLLIIAQDVKRD